MTNRRACLQTQHVDDVLARLGVGGRGQRDERRVREMVAQFSQRGIFRSEIMAPLRHAMSLVDRDQTRP